jgi:hypothetical protein
VSEPTALQQWSELVGFVNGHPPLFGARGVRDPEYRCEEFDGEGYDGTGQCHSDGHYMCTECSHLSPDAPRFQNDRASRGDRLLLFWRRKR